ncbi:acetyl-CoA synthetase-like protein [Colletotrichum somersetense]|nr:acetyl-CoA synthetase-like protein [Colletotrichum somersetense]
MFDTREHVADVAPSCSIPAESECAPEVFSLITPEEKSAVELRAARYLGISVDSIEDIYPATDTQVGLLLQTEKRPGLWTAHDSWELPVGLDINKFSAAWDAVIDRCPILRTRVLQINLGSTSKPKAYQVVLRPRTKYDEWSTQLIFGLVADIYSGKTPRETQPFSRYIRTLKNLDKTAARAFWLSELDGVNADAFQASRFPSGITAQIPQSPGLPEPATQSQSRRKFKLGGVGGDLSSGVVGLAISMPTVLEAAWAFMISAYTSSQDILFPVVQSGRTNEIDPDIVHVVGPTISMVPRRVRLGDRMELATFLKACQERALAAVPFEAAGLEVMRNVLAEGHASINNLLVIQNSAVGAVSNDEVACDDGLASIGLRPETSNLSSAITVAYPFGLVLECVLPRLYTGPTDGQLELIAHYDNNYIKKDTVERLLSHFEHVVNQMIRLHPETLLGEISIWGPGQIKSHLQFVHDRPPPAAVEACVHDMVAWHWHDTSPTLDRPAVVLQASGSDEPSYITLTYRDLDKHSQTICGRLTHEMGSCSESTGEYSMSPPFVAICLEKSPWTVAAMLGVWRAGAAVVLLDPDWPQDRLRRAYQKVNAVLVLVSPATQHLWQESPGSDMDGSNIRSLLMNFPLEEHPTYGQTAARISKPGDACYCVFTSGSTAEPKGVVVQHQAICTSAVYQGREMGLNLASRVLQLSSYSLNAAIGEIVTTLVHRGCVCVVGEEHRRSPADLAKVMRKMKINVALLTPAVLQTLEPDSVPACLKTLVIGGSLLNARLSSLWRSRVRLMAAYGPSECSGTAAMKLVVDNTPPGTIGHPVGCRAWVLRPVPAEDDKTAPEHTDSRPLGLVPLGSVGELVIEGPILAEGYVDDTELTAKRFLLASNVAGGFCQVTGCHPETRLYRTGDLVRQNPHGSLQFVGRMDFQVKVRGVRVELDAIENCILETNGIRGAVVLCPKKGPFSGRLVAIVQLKDQDDDIESNVSFVFATPGRESFASATESYLKEHLPSSHVPTIWAMVSRMPLTSYGKIDRLVLRKQLEDSKARPAPQHDSGRLGYSPSRTTHSPKDEDRRANAPATTSEVKNGKLMAQTLGACNEEAAIKFWNMGGLASSTDSGSLTDPRSARFSISIGQRASKLLSQGVGSIDKLQIGDVVEAVVAKVFTDFCRDKGRKSSPLIYAEDRGLSLHDEEDNHNISRVRQHTCIRPLGISTSSRRTSLLETIWHVRNGRLKSAYMTSGAAAQIPPSSMELIIKYSGRQSIHSDEPPTSSLSPSQPRSMATAAELAIVSDTDTCLKPLALIEVVAVLRDEEGLELAMTYDNRLGNGELLRGCLQTCGQVLRSQVIPNLATSLDPASGWHSSLRILPGLGDETAEYMTSQGRRSYLVHKLGLRSMDEVETIRACSKAQTQILLAQTQAQARMRAVWEVSPSKSDDHGLRRIDDASGYAPDIDLNRLHSACEAVVKHHPSLRTAFVQLPNMPNPLQIILRDGRADNVLRISQECHPGESLSAATTTRLELDVNYASFDEPSSAVLLRDIALAYADKSLNPDGAFAAHQYFAHLEQAQEQVNKSDSFWARHLRDAEPCRLPPLGSGSGTNDPIDKGPALGFFDKFLCFKACESSVSSWCERFGATPSVAIHAAWAIALNAYCHTGTKVHDVCFGWVSSGRQLPVMALENAIGMFANKLICRARIGPAALLRDVIAAMAQEMAEGLQHQFGGPKLQQHGKPLCDTAVKIQPASAPRDRLIHGQLCFRQTKGLDRVEDALLLNVGLVKDTDYSMDCRITYDSRRISEAPARAFFSVFEKALTAIITTSADSATTITDMDLSRPLHHELLRP